MQIKGVLFDMDGVLLESEDFIARAAIMMFKERGLQVKREDFKPFVGAGEDKYLGGVAEKYNHPYKIEEIKKRAYDIYDELVAGNLKPLEGVPEFIERCRNKGLKLAVATSADKRKMLINLRETGLNSDTFDALVNGSEVEKKKPNPDIFILAANKINLEPKECLVVEDAINGVEAARNAGAKCLALTTSFSNEDLKEADWIAKNLKEAPEESINW
jgi:HAD superfamily hydrolase (TIGR01509 family)